MDTRCSRAVTALTPILFLAITMSGCQPDVTEVAEEAQSEPAIEETRAAWIDSRRITNADAEPENWLAHGRTSSEQRFSPLQQINESNVGELSLAWYTDLDTNRGQEATPIVVDGVLYSTSAWSKVQAVDAKTGRLLWQYDPEVPGIWDVRACCADAFQSIVLEGAYLDKGMASFSEVLSENDAEAVRAYIVMEANK